MPNSYSNLSTIELIKRLSRSNITDYSSNQTLKTFIKNTSSPHIHEMLMLSLEFSKRYYQEALTKSNILTNTFATQQFLIAKLSEYNHEVFACLFLDIKNRLIEFEILFHGSINGADVHPRNIVQRALHHNAAGIIIAHNHPSGCIEPSQADIDITKMLYHLLNRLDIKLLDHIIVADNKAESLSLSNDQ